MDIALNKHLNYGDLNTFLQDKFSKLDMFLKYEGMHDWDDAEAAEYIFEYSINHEVDSGFKYCLTLMFACDQMLELLENLSSALATQFECAVSCDASRIILSSSPYYSLMFEHGKVYLADDSHYEDNGMYYKVIELSYALPDYTFGAKLV